MSRVLGFDPGTRVAGYAVLDGSRILVELGVLEFQADLDLGERLRLLAVDLEGLFDEFRPERLALETCFVGKNVRSALVLAEVRGLAKGLAYRRGLSVSEYAPSTVKLRATGRGNSSKSVVRNAMKVRFGWESDPKLDASDAAAIAYCGLTGS